MSELPLMGETKGGTGRGKVEEKGKEPGGGGPKGKGGSIKGSGKDDKPKLIRGGGLTRRLSRRKQRSKCYDRLTQYGTRCDWLKNDKFLRDLEGDSVDTEILEDELRSLSDDEPKTCRGKSVKFLESNPFNIVLCVLVLVDAGVVIAEILLDLHAIRGQYREAHTNLEQVLDFVTDVHKDDLHAYGYHGRNVDKILRILQFKYGYANSNRSESETSTRHKRHVDFDNLADMLSLQLLPSLQKALEQVVAQSQKSAQDAESKLGDKGENLEPSTGMQMEKLPPDVLTDLEENYLSTSLRLLQDNIRLRADIAKLYDGINSQTYVNNVNSGDIGDNFMQDAPESRNRKKRETEEWSGGDYRDENNNQPKHVVTYTQRITPTEEPQTKDRVPGTIHYYNVSGTHHGNGSDLFWDLGDDDNYHHTDAKRLLELAHTLHYCSIAILGVFVLQFLFKLYGMGLEFFKKRMEIFDAVIILASFALDLVFLEGIGGAKGEEAAALLIVFLLWRILRVINGIMITTKKRQEFRIKLQKRARRRGEKKIEILEEDKQLRDKEIAALRELCSQLGGHEDDIAACKPRRKSKGILSRLDTSMGLTSVASLSLSLSMSMSGGVLNMARGNPMITRRDSLQQLGSNLTGPRRPNMGIAQNNVRPPLAVADKTPSSVRFGRTISGPMEKVLEESPNDHSPKKSPNTEDKPEIIEEKDQAKNEKPKKEVTIIEMESTRIEPPPPLQTGQGTSTIKTVLVEQKNGVGQNAKTPPPILKKLSNTKSPSPLLKKSSKSPSPVPKKRMKTPSPILIKKPSRSPSPTRIVSTAKRPPSPRRLLRGRSPSPKKSRSPSPGGSRRKTPPPYKPRKSKSPSPRPPADRGQHLTPGQGEKPPVKMILAKPVKRQERPKSSVTFEVENELKKRGPPPRRAVSSETVVVANGPLTRGSPSPRGSREDIVVRLQRHMGSPSSDDKVQTTKL